MKDLFEHYQELPQQVQDILLEIEDDFTYENCETLLARLEPLGYTFEYGLDAVPYGLRKIEAKISARAPYNVHKAINSRSWRKGLAQDFLTYWKYLKASTVDISAGYPAPSYTDYYPNVWGKNHSQYPRM